MRAGLAACLAAEAFAGLAGFLATIEIARRLGPDGLGSIEVAGAVAGWMLVLVRGGLDQIVIREASTTPRLIGRWTRILIGMRCLWAVGAVAIIGVVAAIGPVEPRAILGAGMILIPSAMVADVGPRARQEWGFLAAIQAVRAAGVWIGVIVLVRGPGDLLFAAMAPAVGESIAAVGCAIRARRSDGWPRPEIRGRAAIVLTRRAAVAGVTRFLRVGLYAADVLVMGMVAGSMTGGYAAARRVAFAIVAIGLVIPSLLAPRLARAIKSGLGRDDRVAADGATLLVGLFLPASLGLILTGDRIVPRLFGPEYREKTIILCVIAARIPLLLIGTWFQSALVAIGREVRAARLMLVLSILGAIGLPAASRGWGPAGVGLAILGIEATGVILGGRRLAERGVTPIRWEGMLPIGLGCLVMTCVVRTLQDWPVEGICVMGAMSYAMTWSLLTRASSRFLRDRRRETGPPETSKLGRGGPWGRGVPSR